MIRISRLALTAQALEYLTTINDILRGHDSQLSQASPSREVTYNAEKSRPDVKSLYVNSVDGLGNKLIGALV